MPPRQIERLCRSLSYLENTKWSSCSDANKVSSKYELSILCILQRIENLSIHISKFHLVVREKQAPCRQIVNQIRDFLQLVIRIASFFVAIKCNQHLAMHCCNQEMAAIAVSSEQAIVSNLVHFQSLVFFLAGIPCALCNTRINARFGGIQFVNYLWPVRIPNIQICKCII